MKLLTLVLLVAGLCSAQERFAVPTPPEGMVGVQNDLEYTEGAKLDLYKPARATGPAPVFIFLNSIGGGDRQRKWAIYRGWGQTAAARGFAAINADSRDDRTEQDFDALLAFIAARGAQLGMDSSRIAVYAASANAWLGFRFMQKPAVKAGVMYYGYSDLETSRMDLPLLFVRAGLDRPGTNRGMDALAAKLVQANAPVSVLNQASGHHGFETMDDTDASREAIERTLQFAKSAMEPAYQASLRTGMVAAEAAGAVLTGNFDKAVANYEILVARGPVTPVLLLAYGEALIGAKKYQAALDQFERIKKTGGNMMPGPRDLGVPASRAAALAQNPTAAIEWIASIPARFRPSSLADDPAFASIRDRDDFRKLFAPQQ